MTTEAPLPRARYLGLSAYWFATSLKWFILFFLLPALVSEVVPGGEKNSWWGLIVLVGATEAMIGPALLGWISDRSKSKWGRRRPFIAVGSALTAIALIVMGQAQSVAGFLVAYLLVQISDDIGTGPYASTIPELVPESARGRASGQMGFLQLAGQLSAVILGLVFGSSPFTILFVMAVVNVLCAMATISSIAKLEQTMPALTPQVPGRLSFAQLVAPLKDRDFRLAFGTRFLNAVGFYIVLNYLINYLADVIKVFEVGPISFSKPFEAAIAMAALLSLSGAISSIINGKRADVIGRKRVIVEAGWIMFIPLILFCFVSSYALLVPLAIVFGVGYGAYLSSDWALVSDVLPDKENPASGMGVWQMSVAAPQVLSGAIGFLIDQGNQMSFGWGYRIAFLIASIAMLMGSVLVRRIQGSS